MSGNGFAAAVEIVLEHEGFGKFTDDAADPGGATQWGISLRFLRALEGGAGDIDGDGDVDADDVRALTRPRAEELYRVEFWERYGYGRLAAWQVGVKVFDLAVNMGPGPAHRVLQRALRANDVRVAEDGRLGPKTLAAANGCFARPLLVALRAEAAGFYRSLVAGQARRGRYLAGWLNRAYS